MTDERSSAATDAVAMLWKMIRFYDAIVRDHADGEAQLLDEAAAVVAAAQVPNVAQAARKPAGCDPCSWPECGCQNSPAREAATRGLAQSPSLRAAAERVCWFDWSDNDMDAVAAIDALRKAIIAQPPTAPPQSVL